MSKQKKVAIKRIRVERLFGLYDYEIPPENKKKIETILILYGDNGSGKTTILRLIFHLLAVETRRGHKTFVATTKFRSLEIEFTNGFGVRALRKGPSLTGSFEMQWRKAGKLLDKTEFRADADNIVRARTAQEEKNREFLLNLRHLGLSLYLLSDDRKVDITSLEPLDKVRYAVASQKELFYSEAEPQPFRIRAGEREEFDPEQILPWLLQNSLDRATSWIRQQVMQDSKRGESNVNIIFSEIIDKIAGKRETGRITREELSERIENIQRLNKGFSGLGLTPTFDGSHLLRSIELAPARRLSAIRPVITPYLDSFEAKLKALDKIQDRVKTLIETLNSFLVDKTVHFHVVKGFTIKSRNKEELSTGMLSSGERHLLLLFCNTMTALDKRSIFIIDEPEISLNVKWQRTLIASLLGCVKDSPVQYIFATHSLELLTQHKDGVIKLESTRG